MDKVYLACVTTDMSAVPNSVEGRCGSCSVPVWISVAGQNLLKADNNAMLICIPCMKHLPPEERSEFAPVPGGIKEALEYLRKVGNASNN